MKRWYCLYFILLQVALSACASGLTSVQNEKSREMRTITWTELSPYVQRHIGMRPKTEDVEAFSFDIGGDFGELQPGMDPEIDQWVADALRENHGLVASNVIELVPGTQDFAKRDAKGNPIPYPESKINEFADRLWQKIVQQNPPVALTHLKFLLARELEGRLQIAGIDLQPTLSSRKKIPWQDLQPYILGFIRVAEHPVREANGDTQYALGFRVCMTDNHVFRGVAPKDMDWNVAMAIFESMAPELSSGSVFYERLEKNLDAILEREEFTIEKFNAASRDQRHAWMNSWENQLHDRLRNDPSFMFTVRGIVLNRFEREGLPPPV